MKLRERPKCRRVIIANQLHPAFAFDTDDGYRVRPLRDAEEWDGVYAISPLSGNYPRCLTDGVRKEMRRMLEERYWNSHPPTHPVLVKASERYDAWRAHVEQRRRQSVEEWLDDAAPRKKWTVEGVSEELETTR